MDPFRHHYDDLTDSPHLVYVVDDKLNLVWHNRAWDEFAVENRGDELTDPNLQMNVLEGFSGTDRLRWQALYQRILSGELSEHTERFACPSPTVRRAYRLTIEPVRDEQGAVVRLIHKTELLEKHVAQPSDRTSRSDRERTMTKPEDAATSGPSVLASGVARPLEEPGGDLIWGKRNQDGTRVMVLADVMGHGELAGKVAQLLSKILESLPALPPGQAVRDLNDRFCKRLPELTDDTMFATGFFLLIDPQTRKIAASNFAHHGLLFSEKEEVEVDAGLPIGLMESDEDWPETVLTFDDLGKRLLAFTDGLVEQFNINGEMFGMDGVSTVFFKTLPVDLKQSLREILLSIDHYRQDALIKDDQTVLGIEIDP